MTLIYFILILGITVFIHELGHFLCAKKFGVYVYEFSIGMGPRLFKFKRKNDETDYCIRLFPIGGFVQMAGAEIEENSNIPKNLQLQSKKAYQRLIIMLAGVFMNFLLAIVLLFFLGLFNSVSFNNVNVTNSVVEGLNDGDKIVAINDHFVNNYDCDEESVSQELCNNIYFLSEFEHISDNIDGLKYDYFEDDAKNYLKELEQPDVYPGRPSKEEYLKQQLSVIKELKELINEIY